MTCIQFSVSAQRGPYRVAIGDGILDSPQLYMDCDIRRAFIVTDRVVAQLHLERVEKRLSEMGVEYTVSIIPFGESGKTLETVYSLYNELASHSATRADAVLALGGGVVGDVAGFVASTFKRGMRLSQLPTTLLSQVDSCLGGKTGVNLTYGKNLVGSFYPPNMIATDVSTLMTLPEREFRSGLAEVVKYAITLDTELLLFLECHRDEILYRDPMTMIYVVERCLRDKARVVESDEFELLGGRAVLNFGHTIGHVLETCSEYHLNHGEAVALGMVLESMVSVKMGVLSPMTLERIVALLSSLGLPTRLPSHIEVELIEGVLGQDKKIRRDAMFAPLLVDVGRVDIRALSPTCFLRQLVGCDV